jgi:hypothetical protein
MAFKISSHQQYALKKSYYFQINGKLLLNFLSQQSLLNAETH